MKDKTPFVTIGIPFYRDKDYLPFAIQSVINQTYQNWELILIDDGSDDGSLDIARSYKDIRIKVVSDGLNKGLPARLNEISACAFGEYVARMDADDIMTKDRIETQVKYLVEYPEADVVGSSAMVINENNEITHSIDQTGITKMFIHPSIMGKKKWFQENPYNIKLPKSQDYELWLRTLNKSCAHNLSRPLLFYRELDALSYKKSITSHKVLRKVYKNYKTYDKTLLWCIRQYMMSYIKDGLYYVAEKMGLMGVLDKWRWHRELPVEMRLSEDDLKDSITLNSHM